MKNNEEKNPTSVKEDAPVTPIQEATATAAKDPQAQGPEEDKKIKKVTPRPTGKRTADNFNRDFSRMRFAGEDYSKGKVVLAVIKKFVEEKKPTLAQLKTAFPDELLPNYGIVRDAAQAKKASAKKKRYFVKNEQLIKLKDGKTVAVANQFSSENIKPFVKQARTLGYVITPKKA